VVKLGIPGIHNAANALAALAVSFELDIAFETAAQALLGFSGVGRRFEIKGEAGGVLIVDDYGHHPTEIKATLAAAREFLLTSGRPAGSRLLVAFQPHRYSRTQDLWDEFVNAFSEPDLLVLADIYPASEKPIPGITGTGLYEDVARARAERRLPTRFAADVNQVPALLFEEARPGDVVLTLGAGNILKAGEELLAKLGGNK